MNARLMLLDHDPCRVLARVRQPFFAHLVRWVAFADLDDVHKEFFIRPASAAASIRVVSSTGNASPAQRKYPLAGLDALEVRRLLGERLWLYSAKVDTHNVPRSFVTVATVEATLAAGRAIGLLREVATEWRDGAGSDLIDVDKAGRVDLPGRVVQGLNAVGRDAAAILSALRAAPAFSALELEAVMTRIRDANLEAVRGLLFRRSSHLTASIAALRDVALLGRGDLFHTFLELAVPVVSRQPASAPMTTEALMQGPWAAAVAAAVVPTHVAADVFGLTPVTDGSVDGLLCRHRNSASSSTYETSPLRQRRGGWPPSPQDGVNAGEAQRPSVTMAAGLSPGHSLSREDAELRARSASAVALKDTMAGEEHDGGSDQVVAAYALQLLPRCRLVLTHRAMMWQASADVLATHDDATDPLDTETVASLSPPTSTLQAPPFWWPCYRTGEASEVQMRERSRHTTRAIAAFFALGATDDVELLPCGALPSGGSGSDSDAISERRRKEEGLVVLQARTSTTSSHPFPGHAPPKSGDPMPRVPALLMASPGLPLIAHGIEPQIRADDATVPVVGAIWLQQSIAATTGFMCRCSVVLMFPIAATAMVDCPPASFAFVLQREHPLVLGHADESTRALGSGRGSGVPSGGFAGIRDSLVVHILVKRLALTTAVPVPSRGVAVPRDDDRFRVVVAVYGPNPATAGSGAPWAQQQEQRPLLASGAVMDRTLARLFGDAITARTIDAGVTEDTCTRRVDARALRVAVEYVAPLRGDAGLFRVMLMNDSYGSPVAGGASDSTSVVVEASLTLDAAVRFYGTQGPGRGRAWMGLTSELPAGAAAAVEAPLVGLRALDVVSYADGADGYASLSPAFDPPWPLHVLIDGGTLGAAADLARVLIRVRGLSRALTSVWKRLALEPGTAATRVGGSRRSRTIDGVSAQLSGAAGRRDPAAAAALRDRLRAQTALIPVAILRSRIAGMLDALQYHLHVDVIDPAVRGFASLARPHTPSSVRSVKPQVSFSDLLQSRDTMVQELVTGAFLARPSLLAAVERCLSRADEFVTLVAGNRIGATDSGDNRLLLSLARDGDGRLSRIARGFDDDVRALVAALEAGAPASPLLSRLLPHVLQSPRGIVRI